MYQFRKAVATVAETPQRLTQDLVFGTGCARNKHYFFEILHFIVYLAQLFIYVIMRLPLVPILLQMQSTVHNVYYECKHGVENNDMSAFGCTNDYPQWKMKCIC
jgi:hypothetical protein